MNSLFGRAVRILVLVLAAGVVPAEAQLVFTDVTEGVGAAFSDQLIESVAWGDYDNDGDLDLTEPVSAARRSGGRRAVQYGREFR